MTQQFRFSAQLRRVQRHGAVRGSGVGCVFLMGFSLMVIKGLAADAPANFQEVYDVIRTNLPGVTPDEFNRASVRAIIGAFGPNVSMGEPSRASDAALISKSRVFDSEVAYARVSEVREGLPSALKRDIDNAASSNKIKGLVIDLRYANGQDFDVAAAVADLFVPKEKPLLTVGGKALKSSAKTDAVNLPVAVLVNGETAGAPEALAALFRETGTGLILGSRTAGQSAAFKDFPLSNGEKLHIACEPVLLGDGSPLPPNGVVPDIVVPVNAAAERAWYDDAFAFIPSGSNLSSTVSSAAVMVSTNRPSRRPRISEAELVRERREGVPLEEMEARANEPDKPQIADPALARAIDLLKGLAVVRRARY